MMGTSIIRAVSARAMFTCHGLFAVWSVRAVFTGAWPMYLLIGGGPLFLETILCVTVNSGREWGRFCPSVACYLLWVLPPLWVLEQTALHERLSMGDICTTLSAKAAAEHIGTDVIHPVIIFGANITATTTVENSYVLRGTRQIILLFIIVSRWLMPKGELTHDQLSQLLLAYIGTAADITDFRVSLQLPLVRCDVVLHNALLGIWSLSLLLFTVLIPPSATITHQTGLLSGYLGGDHEEVFKDELISALSNISMQDLPFLVARTTLWVGYKVYQPSVIFFLFKNGVSIIIVIHRLSVVKKTSIRREERIIQQLLLTRDLIQSQDPQRSNRQHFTKSAHKKYIL